MDCHEPNTHFKLVGVYKESEGLYDWAEQLFKHQGYCLWDEDTYEFMQEYREKWPTYCIQLYFPDEDGNGKLLVCSIHNFFVLYNSDPVTLHLCTCLWLGADM